jgi:hypothetical protein
MGLRDNFLGLMDVFLGSRFRHGAYDSGIGSRDYV